MSRPELKLAGMRIDPDLFAGSKMSYSLSLAVVSSDQVRQAAMCKSARSVLAAAGVDPLAWRWCVKSGSKPNSWQLCGGCLGSVSSSTVLGHKDART